MTLQPVIEAGIIVFVAFCIFLLLLHNFDRCDYCLTIRFRPLIGATGTVICKKCKKKGALSK